MKTGFMQKSRNIKIKVTAQVFRLRAEVCQSFTAASLAITNAQSSFTFMSIHQSINKIDAGLIYPKSSANTAFNKQKTINNKLLSL